MNKITSLTACLIFLLSFPLLSQNAANLVIFSEDAEPFYAIINGVKQNQKAETHIKFTDVTPKISLRIEFENKSLPALKQTMALEPGLEHTARIKRDKNKKLKLRYFGSVPLKESSSDNIPVVSYHTAEDAPPPAVENRSVTSTTTTSQSSAGQTNSPGVSIQTSGVNTTVTGSPQTTTGLQTTTSTTVTQTTKIHSTAEPTAKPNPTVVPFGCSTPMSSSGFNRMKQTIESKPFSDTKMSTAKVATKSACLSVEQIKDLCKLFSMDDDKLIFAKFAYNSCVDKTNYYQVSEVFVFSATTEEFNKFLEQ